MTCLGFIRILTDLEGDKQPQQKWIDDNALYLFAPHDVEWERNKTKLQQFNNPERQVVVLRSINEGKHVNSASKLNRFLNVEVCNNCFIYVEMRRSC